MILLSNKKSNSRVWIAAALARRYGATALLLLILSASCLLPTSAHAAVINSSASINLSSGLVGYWTFDGADMAGVTAYDRSGQGNNGTLTNGPTRTIGKLGQALKFDGVNDRVAPSAMAISGSRSFAAWVYNKGNAVYQGIVLQNGGGCYSSINGLQFRNGTPNDVIVTSGDNVSSQESGHSPAPLNKWSHWVGVIDTTNSRLQLYKNGIVVSDTVLTVTPHSTSVPIYMGVTCPGGESYYLNGYLDDVRIYNRALSAQEVMNLYKTGATITR